MCDVNLTERLAPYASEWYVYAPAKGDAPNVTYGPETSAINPLPNVIYPAQPNPDDVNATMLDLRLRLIAAICDRPSMDPTVKADVLTEIERCRELVARW